MIKIVTDSTNYLPPGELEKYDVRVVPLNVHFGESQTFQEGVTLNHDQFYAKLAEASELPTTSQPSPGQFLQIFSELSEAGHDILCIVISSRLSGTYQSALDAKSMLPEANIVVIDTYSVASPLGLMVITAAEMAADGHTMEEIVARVEQMKRDMRVYFVVDTLEYLQKGGRIGAAAAFLGTLLKVKPILMLDDGVVKPLDKVRSKRKAIQRLLSELESHVSPGQPVQAIAMHAQAPGEVQELEAEIRHRFNCQRTIFGEVGPVVGTHTGPGLLGAAICPEAWPLEVASAKDQEAHATVPA
ncbi:MAG: DegV family protein [Anaerolineales bacterium]|nr:MAG: DegV family protein [Anaerolineales bacterium]